MKIHNSGNIAVNHAEQQNPVAASVQTIQAQHTRKSVFKHRGMHGEPTRSNRALLTAEAAKMPLVIAKVIIFVLATLRSETVARNNIL